ncbi:MAG: PIN domain-containing protein [Oceanipulchritudo sp.]
MSDYLLDVNVLIAHAIVEHEHHPIVMHRLRQLAAEGCRFHVCPLVELGLVRNVMRIGSLPIEDARQLLENEYTNLGLQRIPDDIGASALSGWVRGYRQTTDAYLSTLAEAHELRLLTIDKGIPGAERLLP